MYFPGLGPQGPPAAAGPESSGADWMTLLSFQFHALVGQEFGNCWASGSLGNLPKIHMPSPHPTLETQNAVDSGVDSCTFLNKLLRLFWGLIHLGHPLPDAAVVSNSTLCTCHSALRIVLPCFISSPWVTWEPKYSSRSPTPDLVSQNFQGWVSGIFFLFVFEVSESLWEAQLCCVPSWRRM